MTQGLIERIVRTASPQFNAALLTLDGVTMLLAQQREIIRRLNVVIERLDRLEQ